MATQWAKKEAQTNELAEAVQGALAWAEGNRAAAFGGAAACFLAIGFVVFALNSRHRSIEESWTQFGMAQSLAYMGRGGDSLAQIKALSAAHGQTLAAGYGDLLAADIQYEQGQYREAAAAYRRLSEGRGDKNLVPLALAGLGVSLEASGDFKAAIEADQRFLNELANHPLAGAVHASLARSLAQSGQADKAKSTLERMSFLYPDSYWSSWAKIRLKNP